MKRLPCTIASIEYYNHDTRKVMISLPRNEAVDFKAGQYLEMVLPGKNCPFSIASSPDVKDYLELHIRPTPDSEDSAIIEDMLNHSDRTVEIDFPKGDCFLESAPDTPLILLAASTGVTQMKSIIEYLLPRGLTHPIYLYWGVLADKDLYLSARFEAIMAQEEKFHYIPVVSEPATSPEWEGRIGLVGEVALQDFEDLSDVTVYVSGSPGMVYATLDTYVARGLPDNRMFSDVFSYAPRPAP